MWVHRTLEPRAVGQGSWGSQALSHRWPRVFRKHRTPRCSPGQPGPRGPTCAARRALGDHSRSHPKQKGAPGFLETRGTQPWARNTAGLGGGQELISCKHPPFTYRRGDRGPLCRQAPPPRPDGGHRLRASTAPPPPGGDGLSGPRGAGGRDAAGDAGCGGDARAGNPRAAPTLGAQAHSPAVS